MRWMMGCRWSRILVGLGLVMALGTCAHAESSLDAIRTRGLIRIGVKVDAPPFGSLEGKRPCYPDQARSRARNARRGHSEAVSPPASAPGAQSRTAPRSTRVPNWAT